MDNKNKGFTLNMSIFATSSNASESEMNCDIKNISGLNGVILANNILTLKFEENGSNEYQEHKKNEIYILSLCVKNTYNDDQSSLVVSHGPNSISLKYGMFKKEIDPNGKNSMVMYKIFHGILMYKNIISVIGDDTTLEGFRSLIDDIYNEIKTITKSNETES